MQVGISRRFPQSIISTLVELFFAWRVKVLTGNYWVTALIVSAAVGSACEYSCIFEFSTTLTLSRIIGGGIGTAIAIHFVPQFADFQKFQAIVIVWSVCAMVADSTIALSLTWHLVRLQCPCSLPFIDHPLQRRHKTGFTDTDDILDKIIRRTLYLLPLNQAYETSLSGIRYGAEWCPHRAIQRCSPGHISGRCTYGPIVTLLASAYFYPIQSTGL